MTYVTHPCTGWQCPICHPQVTLPWPPPYHAAPVQQGCICPPTSEQTCQGPMCPRKSIRVSASGALSSDNRENEAK
jgi:hypothetical protein